MNNPINLPRRRYGPLIATGAALQSPFLLVLRLYSFGSFFLTGKGKLADIGKVSELFGSLGISLRILNAHFIGSLERFGSLRLIIGLTSRPLALLVLLSMIVAYLTADFEAVSASFSDPDKFVKADPFPCLLTALIVFVIGSEGFGGYSVKVGSVKLAEKRRPTKNWHAIELDHARPS